MSDKEHDGNKVDRSKQNYIGDDHYLAQEYIDQIKMGLPPQGPPAWEQINDDYRPPTTYTQMHSVERYVRVNVTKNTKGYNTDVTVSVTTHADTFRIESELSDLLAIAREVAEKEIQAQKFLAAESYEDRGN